MIYKIKREEILPYNVPFSKLNFHFNLKEVRYNIKFDKNCYWGPAKDDDDMLLNTLCGIQFGFNKKNSIKLLWRPDFNYKYQMYLYVYSYNNKKHIDKITFIKTVKTEHFFNVKITGFKTGYYEINVEDTVIEIEKYFPTVNWGFFINPHIHEETEAIQDMNFTIEKTIKYNTLF